MKLKQTLQNHHHFHTLARIALFCALSFVLPACATRTQYQKGYEQGASDTVKRQYWILQDLQKRPAAQDSKTLHHLSVYRMTVTPDPKAMVKSVPYEIAIPITQ